MKKYFLIILLLIMSIPRTAGAITYIDDPGNTVVLSSSINDQVYVDYYTATPPGTNLRMISGGSTDYLRLYNYGQLTLDGGSVGGELWFYDESSGNIASGNIAGYIRVTEDSNLTMSGGSNNSDWMGVFDNGQATITGGDFGDIALSAHALVTLHGSNFTIGGQSVIGLLDIPELVNDGLLTVYEYPEYNNVQYKGILSGILSDITSFNIDISITHYTDGRGDTANINLVPEPATLFLLGLGGLALLRKRRTN